MQPSVTQHETTDPGNEPAVVPLELRERVLHEIRRIAEETGATPGSQSFNRQTGLSHALWHGEIWARWSDAVREAGLVPNQRKARLDDGPLLAGIADAARKFGRIPTYAEMLLYRKSGGQLPRRGTLARHFGSKQALLLRLKTWAAEDPDRADIAAMLSDLDEAPPPSTRTATGAVYLFRCGQSYKIGCTRITYPESRVKQISALLPRRGRLVHVIETDDPYGVERYWHRRFAEKRTRGEWFRLSLDDVAVFRQRRFQ